MKKEKCQTCLGTGFKPDNAALGRRAKELREKAGLEQKAVAASMELSRPYYCELEGGHRHWSLDLWQRMLKACGVKE